MHPGVPRTLRALPLLLALSGAGAADARAQRAFEHDRHERVACRECHGAGAEHRTYRVRAAEDCAACHHAASPAPDCRSCHRTAELPAPRTITTAPTATHATPRPLPFAHAVHEPVACGDCHEGGARRAMSRTCTSCHASHHRAEAACASCHTASPRAAHRAEAHLGCGGAGCHAPDRVPPATSSRTLCLVCHAEQREHEPAGTCAACHRVPARRT